MRVEQTGKRSVGGRFFVMAVLMLLAALYVCNLSGIPVTYAAESEENELPQGIYRSENRFWYYAYRSWIDSGIEDGGDIVIVGRAMDWTGDAPEGLETWTTEDGTEKINFNIPSKIDGHKVTGIGNPYEEQYVNLNADEFEESQCGLNNLGAYDLVVVPEGVDTIYQRCFYTSGFKGVSLPDTLTTIGESAFYNDVQLEEINIPKSVVSIGNRAFRRTPWLAAKREQASQGLVIVNRILIDGITAEGDVTIPQSVDAIADWAFCGNATGGDDTSSKLTSVSIPSSVTQIGECAFALCSNLTKVDIQGTGLVRLGNQAFFTTAIKTIYFPSSLKEIPYGVCCKCSQLESVTITGAKTIGIAAFQECPRLSSVALPDTLETLEKHCFHSCPALTEINIPKSVTTIGDRAFKYAKGLDRVILPENLTTIGQDAFMINSDSSGDKIVLTVPEKMTDISGFGLLELEYVTLRVLAGGDVQNYLDENEVPSYQTYMKGMQDIYEGTVSITNNINTTVIDNSTNTTVIDNSTNTTVIDNSTNTTVIGGSDDTTGNDDPDDKEVADSPDDKEVADSPDDKEVAGSPDDKEMADSADDRTVVDNSNNATVMDHFTNTIVVVDNSVHETSITNTTGGGSDGSVDDSIAGKVFAYRNLKYQVNANETSVTFVAPVRNDKTSVSIPKNVPYGEKTLKVTVVAKGACKGMKKLKTVTIGANVNSIGEKAFYNCPNLKTLTIGKNVEEIGKLAFYGDKKLSKITFKKIKNLKSVETAAFYLRTKKADANLKKKQTSKKKMIQYLKNSGVKVTY